MVRTTGDAVDTAFPASLIQALQKLALMHCDIYPELMTVLQGLPSLTQLILRCSSTEATLFDAISISGGPSAVCPNLISIVCGYDL
jgi:hypothetical protein